MLRKTIIRDANRKELKHMIHNTKRDKSLKAIENKLYNYKNTKVKIKNIEIELESNNSEELICFKKELELQNKEIDNSLACLGEEKLNIIKLRYFNKKSINEISEVVDLCSNYLHTKIKGILENIKLAIDSSED